ncbi:SIS domain-containing protein [Pediococcus parvulus]|uniref:SIS domain-containing protein n=1 Tax=Pediococcus parvulus TaxID=54062 RepID=UPI00345EEEF0
MDRKILDLFQVEGEEIKNLSNTIDYDNFTTLKKKIDKCNGNIFLTGCGTSAMAAKKIVHTLCVIGVRAFYLNPSDAVHGGLGAVQREDMVIFISKGGSTNELTAFIPNLKAKDVQLVAITENENLKLAKDSNLVIKVKIEKELDAFNMLATTSTIAVISFFDVLAVSLMKSKKFTENEFLVNHPSGAVGARLREDAK